MQNFDSADKQVVQQVLARLEKLPPSVKPSQKLRKELLDRIFPKSTPARSQVA